MSLPPSLRRRYAMARPSYCGRAVAQRAKAAFQATGNGPGRGPLLMLLSLMLTRMGVGLGHSNAKSPVGAEEQH
jgi:hypothetical protein